MARPSQSLIGLTTIATGDRRGGKRCAAAAVPGSRPKPSRESQRGLDWFVFFLADVQTGFGPFIAVYLTTQKWTQVEIGFVLSIGGIVGLLGQMPGRRDRRCRAFRAAGGGPGGRHHRLCRAGLCVMADLPGRDCRGDAACDGELRAGSGDCGDQSRPGRAVRDRRAAWAQRPLRIARQRLGGGADGRDAVTCCRTRRCFLSPRFSLSRH